MSTATRQTADQVRGIPLGELLRWHGFKIRQEGVSFRARSDRHNIFVTGSKWFDNRTGTGGAGAIDLQMHLCGGDFQTTCHVLAEGFRPTGAGLVFPPNKNPDSKRRPFEELAAQYAVPSSGNWPIARDYLVETRKIDPAIVEELHGRGSIYANNHRPNPGIVFLHRTPHGKVEGATLRDTRHESSFRPCLGNKLTAWFALGDPASAETVVAVESPIEALSYHTLFAGRHDRLAVVSCSGASVPDELLATAYDRRQSFIVGFNNDDAGELGWQRACESTADWPGFKISAECPRRNDWNADLVASVRARIGHAQRRPSLHL
jgi:hypothetical protein